MFKIVCVTNRALCKEEFLTRIERIANAEVDAIVLREKDLSEEEYEKLAVNVMKICENRKVRLILHNFTQTAIKLNARYLHLPLSKLRELSEYDRKKFSLLGASCHSIADAKEAESLGSSYITAGHIFNTNSKKGIPGRGIPFLKEICDLVSIPVYAIGGITPNNAAKVKNAGASGAFVMGDFMRCSDVSEFVRKWE
ncbi:MAG: thiamine phosphate synthase [Selenomonadaceae bacterium]|nr:thiamine phosphate synthase [Selenomonadaceae bacterium]